MFQFSGFALSINRKWLRFTQPGCPIRISLDQWLFAPPQSFSQLITSFFASESLGIHRMPLFTFFTTIFSFSINISLQYVKELLNPSGLNWFYTILSCWIFPHHCSRKNRYQRDLLIHSESNWIQNHCIYLKELIQGMIIYQTQFCCFCNLPWIRSTGVCFSE